MAFTWVKDDKGNRASVQRWGSKESARASLLTLEGCSGCSDCSDCSYCSYCSDCSGCSDCSRCSRCSYCSDCSNCSDCSYCSYCYNCSGCSRCSHCSDCSDCSDCSYCSDCSGCSDCSDCSGKIKLIEVPVVPNIDRKILNAIDAGGTLNMTDWHICETTHCRAGWAVHLAGDAGYRLEKQTSTLFAAMQIYEVSGSPISPVLLFDSNDGAMADMRRRAGVDATKGGVSDGRE